MAIPKGCFSLQFNVELRLAFISIHNVEHSEHWSIQLSCHGKHFFVAVSAFDVFVSRTGFLCFSIQLYTDMCDGQIVEPSHPNYPVSEWRETPSKLNLLNEGMSQCPVMCCVVSFLSALKDKSMENASVDKWAVTSGPSNIFIVLCHKLKQLISVIPPKKKPQRQPLDFLSSCHSLWLTVSGQKAETLWSLSRVNCQMQFGPFHMKAVNRSIARWNRAEWVMLSMFTKCQECVSKQALSSVMVHNVPSHNLGTAPQLRTFISQWLRALSVYYQRVKRLRLQR